MDSRGSMRLWLLPQELWLVPQILWLVPQKAVVNKIGPNECVVLGMYGSDSAIYFPSSLPMGADLRLYTPIRRRQGNYA